MALVVNIPDDIVTTEDERIAYQKMSKRLMEAISFICRNPETGGARLVSKKTDALVTAIEKLLTAELSKSPLRFRAKVRLDRLPSNIHFEITIISNELPNTITVI